MKALEEAIREETAAGLAPDAATQEALQQVRNGLNTLRNGLNTVRNGVTDISSSLLLSSLELSDPQVYEP